MMPVFNRLVRRLFMTALLIGAWSTAVHAQSPRPDWTAVLNGVDGIVVYCLASRDREYSVEVCGKLSETVIAGFAGSRLRAVQTGVVFTGSDVQPGEPTDPAALRQAPGMAAPLVIRLVVLGTRSGNPGATGGFTVSRPFRAAVEAGSAGAGLAGDLVVHERQWVAEGPRRLVIRALVEHGSRQVGALAAEIRSHL